MTSTKKVTFAGMFLGLSVLMPMLFHLTGAAGQIFLPMHIPVILCGFICGKRYGLLVGAAAPVINTLILGMPIIYPIGIGMVFELAAYGYFSGLFYTKMKKVFPALITAMLIGRVIRVIATFLITVPFGVNFVFGGIIFAVFVMSVWGIIIQIVLIPLIMATYKSVFKRQTKEETSS